MNQKAFPCYAPFPSHITKVMLSLSKYELVEV